MHSRLTCDSDWTDPDEQLQEQVQPSLSPPARYGIEREATYTNYSIDTHTTNSSDCTGMAMANAATRSGGNPATVYRSTNDGGLWVGGTLSSQEDRGAERDPGGSRADPGLQSTSCPQSIGQPREEVEPRTGSEGQDTQRCEGRQLANAGDD